MIIYASGKLDVNTFEELCVGNSLDPKKVIFLFPGNSGHHTRDTTLFSIKSGAGLAALANNIGTKGYPVLSLPTTSMENWNSDQRQKAIVQNAIANLYRGLGAGFSFMLPVRGHKNTTYFDQALKTNGTEPNFWGGVQLSANKPLAAHYIQALDQFADFIALPESERQDHIKANPNDVFLKAYVNGQEMSDQDPWLQPVRGFVPAPRPRPQPVPIPQPSQHQPEVRREPIRDIVRFPKTDKTPQASKPEPSSSPEFIPVDEEPRVKPSAPKTHPVLPVPASYVTIYTSAKNPLLGARALLNDYTKNDSAISRFFHGHWNRHHVLEVARIVKMIDRHEIANASDLLFSLNQIQLVNPHGSLARRINFIERKLGLQTHEMDDLKPRPPLG